MKPIAVGDPITTVFNRRDDSCTMLGMVVGSNSTGTCLKARIQDRPEALNSVVPRRFDREGITWIRGHHAPESEEALALRAAWALSGYGVRGPNLPP